MRVTSISSRSVRVVPQQERSTRRLAAFLQAASELFADVGYEAATMQAIANRSESSIGALYNYFPDKQAVAATLLKEYADELRSRLKSLMKESEELSVARFAGLLIGCIINFIQERPAYLNLLAAPVHFPRDIAARRALRSSIANTFHAKNPSLSPERALLAANVTAQIVKAMKQLYLESDTKSKELVAAEFRNVLASYLEGILSEKG